MNDSYLWDKSGEPDPEVEKLEKLLGPLRKTSSFREPSRRRTVWLPSSIAACVGGLGLLIWQIERPMQTHWDVTQLSGQVDRTRLGSGDWLETNGSSRARLDRASTGKLELEPNSRIRILATMDHKQSISLLHGTIHATIWAPEGEFSVASPSATAVDLGCIYTVQTDEDGNGFVRVEAGWVALEDAGQESFIPGGSVCRMRSKRGPGIPYIETSAQPLRNLVADFDTVGNTSRLTPGLASAVPADDVTLWHLLRRVPVADRGAVYDRLKFLVPLPVAITREDAIRADSRTIDAIWTALGYGDADWWRKWKAAQISR